MTADRGAARAAIWVATVMIAQQIAGKATRDALFLQCFSVEALAPMVIGSSVAAVIAALLAARALTRFGPGHILPATFAISAGLFLVEMGLYQVAPSAAAVGLHLHMAILGGMVVSTFWSLVNERFDPHSAKRWMSGIAAGATVGGLLGGVVAERVGAVLGLAPMFPVLAGMHVFCALRVLVLWRRDPVTSEPAQSGVQFIATVPYVRHLALLLVLTTLAAGFIDYVFKAEAARALAQDGDTMLRFFALFYAGASLLAFLTQTALTSGALRHLGLVRTSLVLPLAVAVSSVAALVVPGLASASLVRGAQDVARSSFFRSAYELLYNPLPRAVKRATKLLIDVGAERLGDGLASGGVAVVLLVAPDAANAALLVSALLLSVGALALGLRLQRGYVGSLETSLVAQAEALDLESLRASTTRLTLQRALGAFDVATDLGPGEPPAPIQKIPDDPLVRQIIAFRSRDLERVRATLGEELDVHVAPHVIELLAWDEVKDLAASALRRLAPRITGQLADALLDADEAFAVRRRIPRVLVHAEPVRAREALVRGLDDARFEVRYQCARALHRIAGEALDAADIHAIVARELAVGEPIWAGHRLLDQPEASPLVDDGIEVRHRGLEHVFTLLALVLPQRPVRVAFHGLTSADTTLRGTALEYLDSALPEHLRVSLRRVI